MSGTVPTFLRGAGDMETVHTTDTQAALCFLAVVCWVVKKSGIHWIQCLHEV